MSKVYGMKNISVEMDQKIKAVKEWSIKNFYFNNNKVFYSTYDDVTRIGDIPKEIEFDGYENEKNKFDTPFSHLIYTLIAYGEYKNQIKNNKIINDLKVENERLANELSKRKKKSTPSKNSKSVKVVEEDGLKEDSKEND